MKEKIDVSIIVPVYNVEKYLRRCLDSLINQKGNFQIEIIIVNDGSTDCSKEIADEYNQKYSNIKLINQENEGLSGARNTGIKNAEGKYLIFCDSDDWFDEELVKKVYALCVENELDVCMFDADVCKKGAILNEMKVKPYIKKNIYNKIYTGKEVFTLMHRNKDYQGNACLYLLKKDILKKDIRFYSEIIHEDELFTPLILHCANRVMHFPQCMYHHEVRENSIMTDTAAIVHFRGYGNVFIQLSRIKLDEEGDKEYIGEHRELLKEMLKSAIIFYNMTKIKKELADKRLYKDCIKVKKQLKIKFCILYRLYLIKCKFFKENV